MAYTSVRSGIAGPIVKWFSARTASAAVDSGQRAPSWVRS